MRCEQLINDWLEVVDGVTAKQTQRSCSSLLTRGADGASTSCSLQRDWLIWCLQVMLEHSEQLVFRLDDGSPPPQPGLSLLPFGLVRLATVPKDLSYSSTEQTSMTSQCKAGSLNSCFISACFMFT